MPNDYHEVATELSDKDRDIIRALNSFKEEVEAVDWYAQRVAVASDPELKDIMWHNAKEEMEHAMMTLEWLRRNQEGWDEHMRTYLFVEGSIMDAETHAEDESEDGSLNIGQL
ncbi:ferritin [Peptoniphilus equinus]|uniref:Ferritin n=1 Tax=Peptoniphilus equinus TaxID=3016343 RepID=A0ABY7QVM2_9FIRM|nr:encapsulin-associated ferritin-like protein [Peptoniphilus equinus]WBW50110.1 ferritin [Peptoniphilus equinus]